MRKKSKLMVVGVILAAILSGCGGASESDYKKLEERLSELEKKVSDLEGAAETEEQISPSPTEEERPEGVYLLSDRTPMQIVYELEGFLNPQMAGKDINAAKRSPTLRYRAKSQSGNGSYIDIVFEDWHNDYLSNIRYSLTLNQEDSRIVDGVRKVYITLYMYELSRAEVIYREIENKFFLGAYQKRSDREWNDLRGDGSELTMLLQENRYKISISLFLN